MSAVSAAIICVLFLHFIITFTHLDKLLSITRLMATHCRMLYDEVYAFIHVCVYASVYMRPYVWPKRTCVCLSMYVYLRVLVYVFVCVLRRAHLRICSYLLGSLHKHLCGRGWPTPQRDPTWSKITLVWKLLYQFQTRFGHFRHLSGRKLLCILNQFDRNKRFIKDCELAKMWVDHSLHVFQYLWVGCKSDPLDECECKNQLIR